MSQMCSGIEGMAATGEIFGLPEQLTPEREAVELLLICEQMGRDGIEAGQRLLTTVLPALLVAQVDVAQLSFAVAQPGQRRGGRMFRKKQFEIFIQQSLEPRSFSHHSRQESHGIARRASGRMNAI